MNKKIVKTVVGIIIFIIAYYLSQQFVFKSPSLDKEMKKVAGEINQSCPMMVDSETRLDNAVVLSEKVFQYNYTMINLEKESADIEGMKKYMEPYTTNFIRTSPDMEYYRSNKVTLNYFYKDKNGNHLFTISITPDKYR